MKEYDSLVELALGFVREHGEDALKLICESSVLSHVILFKYWFIEKKLESLPPEEKNTLWEYVYEKFPTRTKEQRLNYCKIIHCIGELFENIKA